VMLAVSLSLTSTATFLAKGFLSTCPGRMLTVQLRTSTEKISAADLSVSPSTIHLSALGPITIAATTVATIGVMTAIGMTAGMIDTAVNALGLPLAEVNMMIVVHPGLHLPGGR